MAANTVNKRSFLLPHMRAFTLIEVMLILVILMCLFMFGIPAGREFFAQHRAVAGANSVVGALYMARAKAVHQGQKIIFCKSADGKTCGGSWNNGQIIIDASGNVLQNFRALPRGDALVWNSSGGKDEQVEWLPSGFTNGQRGTFYYCAGVRGASYSQTIVLLNTGRLYVSPIDAEDYNKFCPKNSSISRIILLKSGL